MTFGTASSGARLRGRRRSSKAIIAVLAATMLVLGLGAAVAQAAGPVILAGIDVEDGGVGGHGPISTWDNVVTKHYGNATNGGTGILVIGGGKDTVTPDDVTAFWNQISTDTGLAVTYVNGASNITSRSFTGFRMIDIVSDEDNTPSGGLTQAENDALTGRAGDIKAFVNGGGALLGFTSDFTTGSYGYIQSTAPITASTGGSYSDITATSDGTAAGLDDSLDICCWHDKYITFPSFLTPLAFEAGTQGQTCTDLDSTGCAAAIGGKSVTIGSADVGVTKRDSPDPVKVGKKITYTITVTNHGPDTATGVRVSDKLSNKVSFVSASTDNGTCSGTSTVTCNIGSLASGASAHVTIVVKAKKTGKVTNTATASSSTTDPTKGNDSATAKTTVKKEHKPKPKPHKKLKCQGSKATIVGTSGDDVLRGTRGRDVITGRGGDDVIRGLAGNDKLCGKAGHDKVLGASGHDEVHGGLNSDAVSGGRGSDLVRGGGGGDVLAGRRGNDIVAAGSGNDVANGGHGRDLMKGYGGNDVLRGNEGEDHLGGGTGFDRLNGGPDEDVCSPGPDGAKQVNCEA